MSRFEALHRTFSLEIRLWLARFNKRKVSRIILCEGHHAKQQIDIQHLTKEWHTTGNGSDMLSAVNLAKYATVVGSSWPWLQPVSRV